MGRPTKYSQEVIEKLCYLIATSSKGLRTICDENEDLPTFKTVFNWLNDIDKKDFLQSYARAKEQQADFISDEIVQIADSVMENTERTEFMGGDGSYTSATTKDNVQRSRLMIDARKWQASKLAPKKYGDKIDVTTDGEKLATDKQTYITLSNGTKIPM